MCQGSRARPRAVAAGRVAAAVGRPATAPACVRWTSLPHLAAALSASVASAEALAIRVAAKDKEIEQLTEALQRTILDQKGRAESEVNKAKGKKKSVI